MAITLKDYTSLYKIKDYFANTVAPKYFDLDAIDGTNVGLFGYITEALANNVEDAFFATTMLFKEMFPVTAEDPESIYLMAALFQMSNHFATPATLSFNILISEEDVINHSTKVNAASDPFYSLYIDRDMKITVEDKDFMLDYDINLQSKQTEDGYTHMAYYVTDGFTNTISGITSQYIKTTVHKHTENNKRYVLMVVNLHQVTKTTTEDSILTNDKINVVTKEYTFDGKIANFEIFYRESASADWEQLVKYIANSSEVSATRKFCYYSFTDENILSIGFNNDDRYWSPAFNSELKVEIYTTLGADGNFDAYTGEEISITGVSTKYSTNKGLIFIGNVRGASAGGYDAKTLEELRTDIIKAYSTVKSFTTANDLTLYFNELKLNANNQLLIIKQRDDALKRLFSSFVLFKDDTKNIIPTNTLSIHLPTDAFDAKYEQTNRYVLNAGKIYAFDPTASDNTKFVVPRTDLSISSNLDLYENPEKYVSVAALPTTNINSNYVYTLTAIDGTKAVGTKWRYDTTDSTWKQYTNYVYINPFLTVLGINPTLVGYYINTINDSIDVDFREVNKNSFNQFVINTIDISRNSLTNDDASKIYTITVKLYPTSKLPAPAFDVVAADTIVPSGTRTFVNPTDSLTYMDNGVIGCKFVIDGTDTEIDLQLTGFDSESYFMTGSLTTDDYISLSNSIRMTKINGTTLTTPLLVQSYNATGYVYTYLTYNGTTSMTNSYKADANINFVIPIPEIISTLINVKDTTTGTYSYNLLSVPLVKANIMKTTTDYNTFLTSFRSMYEYIENALDRLTNNFEIDLKFFNTYGPSNHFKYYKNGDTLGALMDKVNISITFGVKFAITTGVDSAASELKDYIKSYIESDTVSLITSPSLYISNLITDIKNNFTSISYITFYGVNQYAEGIQSFESDVNGINVLEGSVATNDVVPEYLNIDYKIKDGVKTPQVIINIL